MRMWELSWIVTIVLPCGIRPHVLWVTIRPVSDSQVADRLALVVITDCHGSLVSLIVNCLSSEEPLSLLAHRLKNVIWAYLHDGDLLVQALSLTLLAFTSLEFFHFSEATFWNHLRLKSHELRLLHVWVALTTVFMTECFCFSIWIPLIVRLDMSMIFVE